MKKFKFTIRGNEYDVDIQSIEKGIATVEVNGTSYSVEIQHEVKTTKTPTLVRAAVPTPTIKEKKIAKTISAGSSTVKSPLPGTIIKVLVRAGDTIAKGDKLMIMEAMKMENNILAEKDGVVKAIKVKEGDSVLENDVLIEME